jgi:radical SAM protein with 4Fe4S-binding SPASM domain
MIAGLISVVLLVPLFVGAKKGEWGVVAVCGVLIVLVIAGAVISAMDARAWVNRRSYWSKSGKDRAKLRHKWEAQARREEEAERQRLRAQWKVKHEKELRKAEKKRRREMEAEADAWGMSVEEYEAQVKAKQAQSIRERIAKTPAGDLYPCTSFIGDKDYLLGNVYDGVNEEKAAEIAGRSSTPESCRECDLVNRCTNSCGCSNRMNTGDENRVSPLQCTYERMLIEVSDRLGEELYAIDAGAFKHKYI